LGDTFMKVIHFPRYQRVRLNYQFIYLSKNCLETFLCFKLGLFTLRCVSFIVKFY
jgi:hypothetical protein